MNSNDKFDCMMKMRENEQACSTEVSKLKCKYKSTTNKGTIAVSKIRSATGFYVNINQSTTNNEIEESIL